MTSFPHCERRNILRTIEDGTLRVNFNTLWLSLSHAELQAWHRTSLDFPADQHGAFPERVEQFFVLIEKSADMAKKRAAGGTATKEKPAKKAAKKKPLRTTKDEGPVDPAVAAAAEAKVAKTANDPNQPNLPGVETDRIPGVETAAKHALSCEKEIKRLKGERDEARGKIALLLEKSDRSQYKCLGKLWYIEPGGTVLKCKNVKDK